MHRALARAGERFDVLVGGRHYVTRAVVQNAGKNFMRKYDNDGVLVRVSGRVRARDKVAFIPYLKAWDEAEDISVIWRGKPYLVLADNVMMLGDEPVYIWALLGEQHQIEKADYYDDIDE